MFKIHCPTCNEDLFYWCGEKSEWICVGCKPLGAFSKDVRLENLWERESSDYNRESRMLSLEKSIKRLEGQVGCNHYSDWGILGGM